MENPGVMVSVWMTTYNHEKYIAQAIESIVTQKTSFPFELLIGEDCSKDSTGAICQEYADRYPDIIRLFRRPTNWGMMKNGIETLKEAKGKYIAICEGDDYWTDPLKLQKQLDFLEGHPEYSICFSNVYLQRELNPKLAIRNNASSDITYTIEDLARAMLINTVSVMFRYDSVELPDWFEQSHAGDYFIFLLSAKKGKIYYMSKAMAVYRLHPTSTWAANSLAKQLKASIEQLRLIQREFDGKVGLLLKEQEYKLHFNLLKKNSEDATVFKDTLDEYLHHPDDDLRNYMTEQIRVVLSKETNVVPYKRNVWRALRNRLRLLKR